MGTFGLFPELIIVPVEMSREESMLSGLDWISNFEYCIQNFKLNMATLVEMSKLLQRRGNRAGILCDTENKTLGIISIEAMLKPFKYKISLIC